MIWAGGVALVLPAALVGLFHNYWGLVFVMAIGFALSVIALVDAARVATRRHSYHRACRRAGQDTIRAWRQLA
jgi:hypothetical protein